MKILGAGISTDLLCFSKLLKLLNYILEQKDIDSDYKEIVKNMIQFSLLPALGCVESNPGIAQEIWQLLKNYTPTERYEIYDFWFRIGSNLTCDNICHM